ncbi:cation:dicarboxylate symporter family transporter [Rubellicoccus peritrichatus]|uniref:Cation:dicarboxylase symporter family transporter n=1 Tax=Rubellicoccus peritrichatus TaxID=3080537 RepID=A0AAQ3LC58_9BACT|nr:cation:dicarboxylase symporter family transporter [Puniceicoccus sp. CR14]WOO42965.1 cation:dicarboxylase symporter family transporter [Puniceicoccus sp. CR14]
MILIGVVLGGMVGVFLGEYAAKLQILGDAFIRLLQMTILPYITISLITGIGGLNFAQAKQLALRLIGWLLIFWVIGMVIFMATSLTFPSWQSASFFSSSLVELKQKVDFLEMYIPANPFSSLANNVIPAVVLFSLSVGVALISIKEKGTLIDSLKILSEALTKVTGYVVKLTPIGVFAISASAAGTMTWGDLAKLQVYIVSFLVVSVVLTFYVLPLLVSTVTPFKMRDILSISKDALLTGFTTGNLFVILPVLTEGCRELFKKYDEEDEHTDAYVDVVIPVSFNFPNLGKLIMLIFVLFAGWFSGSNIGLTEYPGFIISGLFSLFGSVDVAIPFLLKTYSIPTDLYQFYLVTGVINGRFATLLAAMNLLTFTLVVTCAVTGRLQIKPVRIVKNSALAIMIVALSLGLTRLYFEVAVENEYEKDKQLANMHLLVNDGPYTVYKEAPPPPPLLTARESRLERIKEERKLRVGYLPDRLPFVFWNDKDELVGLDVDLAMLLAHELKCEAEFIPVQQDGIEQSLERAEVDFVIGGLAMNTARLERMRFTTPYLDLVFAFIVLEKNRELFDSSDKLNQLRDIKVAVTKDSFFKGPLQRHLPNVDVIEVTSYRDYFEQDGGQSDAILASAQAGSAWTLLYPKYSVVIPQPDKVTMPLGFPIARQDEAWADFFNSWILLKKGSSGYQEIYDYWILGEGANDAPKRWSVIRNVLGWVE